MRLNCDFFALLSLHNPHHGVKIMAHTTQEHFYMCGLRYVNELTKLYLCSIHVRIDLVSIKQFILRL